VRLTLKAVIQEYERQDAVGSGDADCQPHLKIKVQSGASDSVSNEEGQEDTLAYQAQETMNLGIPPWAKRFSTLAKSLLQAALQAAHSQGKDTAGFKFYPVLERPDPNNPGIQQRFHDQATDWHQWPRT
jgi:hypothetical protein